MSTEIGSDLANVLLSAVEDLELPLLQWGMTDVSTPESDVLDTLDQCLVSRNEFGLSADEALEWLTERGYVHHVPATTPRFFRSRLAEALRLTVSLRQLFPRSATAEGWWNSGKELVSDFRLDVRSRLYPKRNLNLQEVMTRLNEKYELSDVERQVADALIGEFRLSKFQEDSLRAIYGASRARVSRAVVIGAGTGSGKTVAFFLPAFSIVASETGTGSTSTACLAIYPRNELLRDQAFEALNAVERINPVLSRSGRRELRLGVLYGSTPWDSKSRFHFDAKPGNGSWRRVGAGHVVPYFPCTNCGSDLVWRDQDRLVGTEILYCLECSHEVTTVALTRRTMAATPPDFLFTTTEMMSLNSTSRDLGKLLSWTDSKAPRFVLFDEAHTYSDVHGAQVALMIRRWTQALRSRGQRAPVFVGLSATLQDAPRFFSSLTGVPENLVEYIEPSATELEARGRQYSVVVRSSATSGAGVLSTTIQAAMLWGRIMQPLGDGGIFGSRGFVFTDDLDVTNRLFNDLRDAEGEQQKSRSGLQRVAPLASLRSRSASLHLSRYRAGQSWDLVEEIGHRLDEAQPGTALRIGRTSSQDTGVNESASLIVATSALEVGFNDRQLGLVLQHKAPNNGAGFIQRMGRAGRTAEMRPVTVVTLSDFGRDRQAYMAYEDLFDPYVAAKHLPLGNLYVLKIQGAHALLDWLSLNASMTVDSRSVLKVPRSAATTISTGQRVIVGLLERLLDEESEQDRLANYLVERLQITQSEATEILWSEPRSLFLSLIPTMVRRLKTNWLPVEQDPSARPGALLPEFITEALFGPLSVPDVSLHLPFGDRQPVMDIAGALRECAPGRVSRRFGFGSAYERAWVDPGEHDLLALETFVTAGRPEGEWTVDGNLYQVLRPLDVELVEPDGDVLDSSNGSPVWRTAIERGEHSKLSAVVPEQDWLRCISKLAFDTHAAGSPVLVRRFAIGSRYQINLRSGGGRTRRTIGFTADGEPAALGFSLEADALVATVTMPDLGDTGFLTYATSGRWRTAVFGYLIATDERLEQDVDDFQREWIRQVFLTLMAVEMSGSTATPAGAAAALADGKWARNLAETIGGLYRSTEDDSTETPQGVLIDRLQTLASIPIVRTAVDEAAEVLWVDRPATDPLVRKAFRDTVAAAFKAAVMGTVPTAMDGDLVVDVDQNDPLSESFQIVVSETSSGGLGVIEAVATSVSVDQNRFWALLRSAFGPTENEANDSTLRRVLSDIASRPGGDIASALTVLRDQQSSLSLSTRFDGFLAAWERLDGPPRHGAVAAFNSRLNRAGGNRDTDLLLFELVTRWAALEERWSIDVEARTFAYLVATNKVTVPGSSGLSLDQIYSLLWERGSYSRSKALDHYNPYAKDVLIDRLLAASILGEDVRRIRVDTVGWVDSVTEALAQFAEVDIACSTSARRDGAAALRRLLATAVDRGALRLYPSVSRVERSGDEIIIRIVLGEVVA
ncbi:protein DpdJ [Aeromicrobium sp. A1-2]|uniref:protein DpdJ n=1 Tax=Aeromicrobium sp. A1-2 TaxID=2107713 RepID=UPI0013C2B2E8|nr:protein DpdJ [Aeromicrobium sp. A1-2]